MLFGCIFIYNYSSRNATTGSILEARNAGTNPANAPANINNTVAAIATFISTFGLTKKSLSGIIFFATSKTIIPSINPM